MQIGFAHIGAAKVGIDKFGFDQHRVLKIGAPQIGARQIDLRQIGARQIRIGEIGFFPFCIPGRQPDSVRNLFGRDLFRLPGSPATSIFSLAGLALGFRGSTETVSGPLVARPWAAAWLPPETLRLRLAISPRPVLPSARRAFATAQVWVLGPHRVSPLLWARLAPVRAAGFQLGTGLGVLPRPIGAPHHHKVSRRYHPADPDQNRICRRRIASGFSRWRERVSGWLRGEGFANKTLEPDITGAPGKL